MDDWIDASFLPSPSSFAASSVHDERSFVPTTDPQQGNRSLPLFLCGRLSRRDCSAHLPPSLSLSTFREGKEAAD